MSSDTVRQLITRTITTLQHFATLHHISPNYTSLQISPINWNFSFYDSLFVSEAFERTIETFGALDIVVNNAGIFDDVQWVKEVDINLVGHRYLYLY
jgi:NAD(P)-dependent dehydrogenase (short-subunit alcohol dehydrogenase family)